MAAGLTIAYVTKDDNEVKDWTLDWSKELATGDTIASSTWSAPAGLTVVTDTKTTTTTTVWLSGGTVGQRYIVVNTITTASSPARVEERAIEVLVTESTAQSLDHYCTLDDINKLVPQVPFTDTSKPNQNVVIGLVEKIARRIDATIANVGYVVPVVAGANALELLREACAWGVLGLAQQMRDTGVTTAVSENGRPTKNIWTQQFEEWLKKLTNPQDPFELPDAPRTNEQLVKQPDSVLRSFVQGVTDDTSYDPNAPVVSRYQVL